MALSSREVEHVARLARLALTAEELAALADQLSAVLDYVDQLSDLDLDAVDPAPYPFPMTLPGRPDTPGETLSQEEAVAGAPTAEGGAFTVPRVLG